MSKLFPVAVAALSLCAGIAAFGQDQTQFTAQPYPPLPGDALSFRNHVNRNGIEVGASSTSDQFGNPSPEGYWVRPTFRRPGDSEVSNLVDAFVQHLGWNETELRDEFHEGQALEVNANDVIVGYWSGRSGAFTFAYDVQTQRLIPRLPGCRPGTFLQTPGVKPSINHDNRVVGYVVENTELVVGVDYVCDFSPSGPGLARDLNTIAFGLPGRVTSAWGINNNGVILICEERPGEELERIGFVETDADGGWREPVQPFFHVPENHTPRIRSLVGPNTNQDFAVTFSFVDNDTNRASEQIAFLYDGAYHPIQENGTVFDIDDNERVLTNFPTGVWQRASGFDRIDEENLPGVLCENGQVDCLEAVVQLRSFSPSGGLSGVGRFRTTDGAAIFGVGLTPPEESSSTLVQGEANGDGTIDVSDAVFILGFLFLGNSEPSCLAALDANADDAVDLSDAVMILGNLFLGNPPTLPGIDECQGLSEESSLGSEESQPCAAKAALR